jgi:adenine phosphoribosyltransferase
MKGDEMLEEIKTHIKDVPDFPKKGILFKDITPIFKHPRSFRWIIDHLADRYRDKKLDYVLGIESRGYLIAAPLAYQLGCGLVLVRKPGKLPRDVHRVAYDLEYGTDSLEIHKDAIEPGARTIVIDDVLATGGTARAAAELVRHCAGDLVELTFLIELTFLNGGGKLGELPHHAMLRY